MNQNEIESGSEVSEWPQRPPEATEEKAVEGGRLYAEQEAAR